VDSSSPTLPPFSGEYVFFSCQCGFFRSNMRPYLFVFFVSPGIQTDIYACISCRVPFHSHSILCIRFPPFMVSALLVNAPVPQPCSPILSCTRPYSPGYCEDRTRVASHRNFFPAVRTFFFSNLPSANQYRITPWPGRPPPDMLEPLCRCS